MKFVLENQVPIDALPYVDPYNEAMKRQVDALVKEEMRRFVPPNYLAQLPAPPTSDFKGLLLEADFARMASGGPIPRLDISCVLFLLLFPTDHITRYKVEPPQQSKRGDPEAWANAIGNAQAQLEHQYLRLTNLELLNNYGGNMWKIHNAQVEEVQRNITKVLDQYKKEIEEINRLRKSEQEAAGTKLSVLHNRWTELIEKNLEIDTACLALEHELAHLRAQLAAKEAQPSS